MYETTKNNSLGEKVPNAEIIFTSEDGTTTQKIKTGSAGRYKIRLKPARYKVTIKHEGYISYSSGSGFTVVDEKFGMFNIRLTKLLKYPLKRRMNNIITVFNRKTGKLIDLVARTKKNEK